MTEPRPSYFPAMSLTHVRAICRYLSVARPSSVWEWGAGGSTLYFPAFLAALGVQCNWTSVETSRRWADRIIATMSDVEFGSVSVEIIRLSYGLSEADDSAHRVDAVKAELKGYEGIRGRHDLIIVDAHKRARCIRSAAAHVLLGGAIILHDAQREQYQGAVEELVSAGWRKEVVTDEDGELLFILRTPS